MTNGSMNSVAAARRTAAPNLTAESYEAASLTPLGHNGAPGDIARVVAFLLSPEAAFINGASIVADGGYSGVDYYMKKENDSLG